MKQLLSSTYCLILPPKLRSASSEKALPSSFSDLSRCHEASPRSPSAVRLADVRALCERKTRDGLNACDPAHAAHSLAMPASPTLFCCSASSCSALSESHTPASESSP